jgi:hypothetical protein
LNAAATERDDVQIREATVEDYLVNRVKELGGECRKVKWIGRNGAPDRLVMLCGRMDWVELKRPGEKAKPHQVREHERMRRLGGQKVFVLDCYEDIDVFLARFR